MQLKRWSNGLLKQCKNIRTGNFTLQNSQHNLECLVFFQRKSLIAPKQVMHITLTLGYIIERLSIPHTNRNFRRNRGLTRILQEK